MPSGCRSTWPRCTPGSSSSGSINWKVAAGDELDVAQASTVKTFGSEFFVEAFRLLMEVLGSSRVPRPRLGRIGATRPPRDELPQPADPHLRWRDQRDPAGPDRDVRPGHAPGDANVTRRRRPPHQSRPEPTNLTKDRIPQWTSHSNETEQAIAELAAQVLGDAPATNNCGRSNAPTEHRFDRSLWATLAETGRARRVRARGDTGERALGSSPWPQRSRLPGADRRGGSPCGRRSASACCRSPSSPPKTLAAEVLACGRRRARWCSPPAGTRTGGLPRAHDHRREPARGVMVADRHRRSAFPPAWSPTQ